MRKVIEWLTHDPHAEALERQYRAELARQARFVRMREVAEAFAEEFGREATPREIWERVDA